MAPRIHLVLADDWELRGDGSGNMRAIQFATMRRLREVYEQHGLRGSFNVEVMQQLTHLALGRKHDELHRLASEWEQIVRETYARGHDIQLHLHPQWSDAAYEDGHWHLAGPWSILDYHAGQIRAMVERAKAYLEGLLRPVNPDYRCVSFRSGSWCIAPSADVLTVLAELGIVFDMSIVDGLLYDTQHVKLDYRHIDEPFLPYYPVMDDARRVAPTRQPIVCLPTHSFRPSPRRSPLRRATRRIPAARPIVGRYLAPNDVPIADCGYSTDYANRHWNDSGEGPAQAYAASPPQVSDLATLRYVHMKELVRDIRARARASACETVPVVLENHTKDIGNFAPLHRFAAMLAKAPDIDVLTPTDVAQNLRAGLYSIRSADGHP
jgi:hypothetical protein